MKRLWIKILTLMIVIILACGSYVNIFAAVNGQKTKKESIVEYTFYISDAVQTITGIHLEFFFDQNVLELKDVNTDNLPNSTINANSNRDGSVKIVNGLINGAQGLACSEKTELVRLTFEVIGEGDTEIKYYIPYMYDYDLVNLYDYTLSQTITIDGKTVIEDTPPVLADDTDFEHIEGFEKGDFPNTKDGKGHSNASQEEEQTEISEENREENYYSFVKACVYTGVIASAVSVVILLLT